MKTYLLACFRYKKKKCFHCGSRLARKFSFQQSRMQTWFPSSRGPRSPNLKSIFLLNFLLSEAGNYVLMIKCSIFISVLVEKGCRMPLWMIRFFCVLELEHRLADLCSRGRIVKVDRMTVLALVHDSISSVSYDISDVLTCITEVFLCWGGWLQVYQSFREHNEACRDCTLV